MSEQQDWRLVTGQQDWKLVAGMLSVKLAEPRKQKVAETPPQETAAGNGCSMGTADCCSSVKGAG